MTYFDANHERLCKQYRNARAAKDGSAGRARRELRQYVAHLLEEHNNGGEDNHNQETANAT